jgi:hypothetical protein
LCVLIKQVDSKMPSVASHMTRDMSRIMGVGVMTQCDGDLCHWSVRAVHDEWRNHPWRLPTHSTNLYALFLVHFLHLHMQGRVSE